MNLPRSGQIRRAFKTTVREIKLTLKEVNRRAAKLTERGNYVGAQELMSQGQQIHAFLAEVQALQKRVSSLRGGGGGEDKPGKDSKHALWEYYQPILKCLVALGGEAIRADIEARFQEDFADWLKPGDLAGVGRGRKRWSVMIGRARKHLKEEGFIETPNLLRWRITKGGREAASQEPRRTQGR